MPKGVILILAAGNSSRLGRSKQLVEISKGETLLNHTIDIAISSQLGEVYVVLGSDYKKHAESIKSDVYLIENNNWQAGMGASLKVGLKAIISNTNQLDFIVVTVCDQPHLRVENISALSHEFDGGDRPIIASKYKEGFGVPVLFSSSLFQDLLKLDDRHGALKFLKQNMDKCSFVDFKKGNIDIDTPDDLLNHLSN